MSTKVETEKKIIMKRFAIIDRSDLKYDQNDLNQISLEYERSQISLNTHRTKTRATTIVARCKKVPEQGE